LQQVLGFFSGVAKEMRKVSWPKKKELINYTTVVITTIVIMAAFFTVVDLTLSEIIRWITNL